jgi:hypothetical protein
MDGLGSRKAWMRNLEENYLGAAIVLFFAQHGAFGFIVAIQRPLIRTTNISGASYRFDLKIVPNVQPDSAM